MSLDQSTKGWSQATPSGSPQQALVELKIALPRKNAAEIRTYRFFIEVVAPSIAGVFDWGFWLSEVPRACFVDLALWHAVVSLGAAYEIYLADKQSPYTSEARKKNDNFILQQSNLAIKALVGKSLEIDKWRTLTASVLFIHICSLQNHHEQAFMHLSAAHRIVQTMLLDGRNTRLTPAFPHSLEPIIGEGPGLLGPSSSIPVSLNTVQEIVSNLESHRQALNSGGLIHETNKNHNFNLWLSYREPLISPGKLNTCYATSELLINANRAAESLFYGLILYSQKHCDKLAAVLGKNDISSLQALISGQEPYRRCYIRLRSFYEACAIEIGRESPGGSSAGPHNTTTKAILSLRLLLTTMRLQFFRNLDTPSEPITESYIRLQFETILSTADQIFQLENVSSTASFIPTPSTTQPLYIVAHSGFPQSLRRRAIYLLRKHPRCDGVWDTSLSAALADLTMRLERASATCREGMQEDVSHSGMGDYDIEVEALDRVYRYRVIFQGDRTAVIVSQTWREFLGGLPERRSLLNW
ncbi:hypothetical protein NPX13_g2492 [Xylaria arbuscula]|uniref:Uncharacterized protein n=1 Tax=Xylaria arbuscula TaxID=114810 RepID=A0A9W8NK40_9PEZI|nr:hypothetical protein NPX13_g2492 [Xylaria arbuscula]